MLKRWGLSFTGGTYTPAITAGSGSFTSVSAVGKWWRLWLGPLKLVFVRITVTNTTNGSAAGSVIATIPFNVVAASGVGVGTDQTLTGNQVKGQFGNPSADKVVLTYYNSTYPSGTGGVLVFNGLYEAE